MTRILLRIVKKDVPH